MADDLGTPASLAPPSLPAGYDPSTGVTPPDGMVEVGNIDVNHRPIIWNDDGSPSTIYSSTVPTKDGKWALIPTIANGKFLTPDGKIPKRGDKVANQKLEQAATDHYKKTGEHLGIFNTSDAADNYANATHAWMPNGGPEKVHIAHYNGDSNMPLTRSEYETELRKRQAAVAPAPAKPQAKSYIDFSDLGGKLVQGVKSAVASEKKALSPEGLKANNEAAEAEVKKSEDEAAADNQLYIDNPEAFKAKHPMLYRIRKAHDFFTNAVVKAGEHDQPESTKKLMDEPLREVVGGVANLAGVPTGELSGGIYQGAIPLPGEGGLDPEEIEAIGGRTISMAKTAPNPEVAESAQRFNAEHGGPVIKHGPVDLPSKQDRNALADAYDVQKHEPNKPAVKKSYDAFKKEALDQFNHAQKDLGIKFDFTAEDPYKSAQEMQADVRNNHHLSVFTGGDIPKDHPMAEIEPSTGQPYNNIFRATHDIYGHAAGGHDFTEAGEHSAYGSHNQMFSPEARPAMRTETQGQSNWYFNNEGVREGGEPGFANQKATILQNPPSWTEKTTAKMDKSPAGAVDPRTGESDTTGVGTEIYPEGRAEKPLDHRPTADDIQEFHDKNKAIFDKHPELRVGWDHTDKGWELNIGAAGTKTGATNVGTKLGQRAVWDIEKGEEIPTGGTGEQTKFPDYPLEQRLADLKGGTGEKPTPQQQVINDIRNVDQSKASALLAERDGKVRIKDLSSIEPGKGNASKLLAAITNSADKNGVNLELTASPYGDEATRLDHDQLKAFYQRHGFVDEPGHDPALGYMVREPKSPNADIPESKQAATPEEEPEPANVWDRAEKMYGRTTHVNKAGFISPDGDMLDFSGGQGARTIDHGDIAGVKGVDRSHPREDFISQTGAVRLLNSPNYVAFDFDADHPPTDAQIDRIVPLLKDGKKFEANVSTMNKEKYNAFSHTVGGAIDDVTDREGVERVIRDARLSAARKIGKAATEAIPEPTPAAVPVKARKGSTTELLTNPIPNKTEGELLQDKLHKGLAINGQNVTDFQKTMGKWVRDTAGDINKPSAVLKRSIDIAKHEINHWVMENGGEGQGWYRRMSDNAINSLKELHPQLEDPAHQAIFKALWTAHSYGNDPIPNMEQAERNLTNLETKGKIEYDQGYKDPVTKKTKKWGGHSGNVYTLAKTQHLIDTDGEAGAAKWLTTAHTWPEIKDKFKDSGLNVSKSGIQFLPDGKTYGAMAFGPKGGAFFLNLNGITDFATVDIWSARSLRRWEGRLGDPDTISENSKTGLVEDNPPSHAEINRYNQVARAAAEDLKLAPDDIQALQWYYEHKLYEVHGVGQPARDYEGAAKNVINLRKQQRESGDTRGFAGKPGVQPGGNGGPGGKTPKAGPDSLSKGLFGGAEEGGEGPSAGEKALGREPGDEE